MIQLFRRIRQKLITEGHLSKYLIYATGEIALVMIGILLALQVNNWNEGRKNRYKEQGFLHKLQRDIEADTSSFSTAIHIINLKEACLRSIHDGTISNFSYDKRASTYDIFLSRFSSLPIVSDNTFTEITSSGNWDIVSNDNLKEQVFNYYRFIRNRTNALQNKFSEWPKLLSELMPANGVYDPGYEGGYELPQDQIDITLASILTERERLTPHINAELQYTVKQKVSFHQLMKEATALIEEIEEAISLNEQKNLTKISLTDSYISLPPLPSVHTLNH